MSDKSDYVKARFFIFVVVFVLGLALPFYVYAAEIPDVTTESVDVTTEAMTELASEADYSTTESYVIVDETLLQHEYIDSSYMVVTNSDFYELQIKTYNLLLLFYWTIVAFFVINRVFDAFKPMYKVFKE